METDRSVANSQKTKVQLDDAERTHLEKVVLRLRERVEQTVSHWIKAELNLARESAAADAVDVELWELREQ